ncbi:hypothetical protein [Paenibacillus brevis]|uniref:Lipoprotein n=1 Tax=Paenibacillus brevis TaxID=2841508 RepID=A0ABS6FWS3_9BACL|nr:hypothetical protein [Paenibacillus brevis]MBU5674695.1 hypothetical protein [Paenibacillus brevis]
MKRVIYICLVAAFLVASGCGTGTQNTIPPTAIDQSPQNYAGLSITNGVVEWNEGSDCCKSFEDTLLEMPFEVRIPKVPFQITNQAAEIVPANFNLIRLTFANVEHGEQLILSISNSKDESKPEGKKGPKLNDGTQTWIQSNQNLSGLYWKSNGLNYALASSKAEGGDFLPLYDISELIQIANSLEK